MMEKYSNYQTYKERCDIRFDGYNVLTVQRYIDDMLVPLHEKYKDDPGVVIVLYQLEKIHLKAYLLMLKIMDMSGPALDINKEAFEAYNGIKFQR